MNIFFKSSLFYSLALFSLAVELLTWFGLIHLAASPKQVGTVCNYHVPSANEKHFVQDFIVVTVVWTFLSVSVCLSLSLSFSLSHIGAHARTHARTHTYTTHTHTHPCARAHAHNGHTLHPHTQTHTHVFISSINSNNKAKNKTKKQTNKQTKKARRIPRVSIEEIKIYSFLRIFTEKEREKSHCIKSIS